MLRDSGLAGISSFVLRDLSSGALVEAHRPLAPMPPASVTKAITTLYALDNLGPDYRFRTRIGVTGPVVDGRVQGDLYLVGDGDPHLDTDGLAGLAKTVAAAGIYGVNGNAYTVAGALPYHREIEPGQPSYAGYNPAISGLNLNFNRVHFEWKPAGGQIAMSLTARSTGFDPPVQGVEMRVVDRQSPVFDYRMAEGRDLWSVSRPALGRPGARWLPVRAPELYAAEVFRTVAYGYNLRLPLMRPATALPEGIAWVAETQSASLSAMSRAMLKYSTNLTAEVLGLRACQQSGGAPMDIRTSSAAMTDWVGAEHGLAAARFMNHSGLSVETRVTAAEMAQILHRAAPGPLAGLMKPYPVEAAGGGPLRGATVTAKTGTLHFARGLGGYLTAGGRRFAFAIFAADLDARAEAARVEVPRGANGFRNRARAQERALLAGWAKRYGA